MRVICSLKERTPRVEPQPGPKPEQESRPLRCLSRDGASQKRGIGDKQMPGMIRKRAPGPGTATQNSSSSVPFLGALAVTEVKKERNIDRTGSSSGSAFSLEPPAKEKTE